MAVPARYYTPMQIIVVGVIIILLAGGIYFVAGKVGGSSYLSNVASSAICALVGIIGIIFGLTKRKYGLHTTIDAKTGMPLKNEMNGQV